MLLAHPALRIYSSSWGLEIEYDIADGVNSHLVVHRECYLVWFEEFVAAGLRAA